MTKIHVGLTRDEFEWLEIYFGNVLYAEEVFEIAKDGRIQSLARVVKTTDGERFVIPNRNSHDVKEFDDFLPDYTDYIPILEDCLWVKISKITTVSPSVLQLTLAEGGRVYVDTALKPPYKPIIYHHCCIFTRDAK